MGTAGSAPVAMLDAGCRSGLRTQASWVLVQQCGHGFAGSK